jgi:diaminohydroxyphosphoribosylaminopyrimidine deaminase/5-amino-6-(5-phosphoribosylamino)uracil reductase
MNKTNTIIFHNSSNNSKIKILKQKKIILIKFKLKENKLFDLKLILKKLYIEGVRNLLVEGGDKITKSFLKKRLFNQFYLFKSPNKLLKDNKNVSFTSFRVLNKKYNNKFKINSKLAKDSITIYKR